MLAEAFMHFGINSAQAKKLCAQNINDFDVYKSLNSFDVYKTSKPLSIVNLYYFADDNGNFYLRKNKTKKDLIANAILESLELNFRDKAVLYEYLEYSQELIEGNKE